METKLSEEEVKKKNKINLCIIIAILLLIIFVVLIFALRTPTYKVIFDSNGGTEVGSIEVKRNQKIEKPNDPSREGYSFVGWYYMEQLYDFDLPVTQNITLKAEWNQNGNGEEIVPGNEKDANAETTEKEDDNANEKENDKNVSVTGVSISGQKEIYVGETTKLSAKINPSNATNQKVTWKSSDSSIAKIDQNGKVTGLKTGKVTITVITKDGNKKATYTVVVKEKQKEIVSTTGVTVSGPSEVKVNSTITLSVKVKPNNATNKKVTWKSSDSSIASVNQNGKVTGLKEGKVDIIVRTEDGSYEAKHTVTVKSVYTITLKAMTKETGIYQYAISVTKDGKAFNNYKGVSYNGRTSTFKQYVAKNYVNTSVKTAEIILSSGRVKATVLYK